MVIDNCGMASEPECMIPIVTFSSSKQVVVLGDCQQVPSKVSCPVARSLGLGASLLDRYRDRALTLNTQYRMVSPAGSMDITLNGLMEKNDRGIESHHIIVNYGKSCYSTLTSH